MPTKNEKKENDFELVLPEVDVNLNEAYLPENENPQINEDLHFIVDSRPDLHMALALQGLNHNPQQVGELVNAPIREQQQLNQEWQTLRVQSENLLKQIDGDRMLLYELDARYENNPENTNYKEQRAEIEERIARNQALGRDVNAELDKRKAPNSYVRHNFGNAREGAPRERAATLNSEEFAEIQNKKSGLISAWDKYIKAGSGDMNKEQIRAALPDVLRSEWDYLNQKGQTDGLREAWNNSRKEKQTIEADRASRAKAGEDNIVIAAEKRIRNALIEAARKQDGKRFAELANSEGINFEDVSLLNKLGKALGGFKIGSDEADSGSMRAYLAKWDTNKEATREDFF